MTTPRQQATDTIERRTFHAEEMRVMPIEGTPGRLLGHAAIFSVWSEDLGGFRELVEPGAFADSIPVDDIRALFNHEASLILGRNRASTLRLAEDERGLAIEIDLPDTGAGRDMAESVNRGDVTQMSFGFQTIEDLWERTPGAAADGVQDRRRLRKVQLFDVSPATFPAYPQTDLALRSLEAFRKAQERELAAGPTPLLDRARRRMALLGR